MALFIGGAACLVRHHAARRVMMPCRTACHVAVLSATQPLLRILFDFRVHTLF